MSGQKLLAAPYGNTRGGIVAKGTEGVHGLSLTALDKHVDKWGKVLYGTAKWLIYREAACTA